MLRLKKQKEEEAKAALAVPSPTDVSSSSTSTEGASGGGGAAASSSPMAVDGASGAAPKKISLLNSIGGKALATAQDKEGAAAKGKRRTPGEIRIQKGERDHRERGREGVCLCA